MSITEKIKRKGFNWFIDEETKDAQKKFGFQINTGKILLGITKLMRSNTHFYRGISAITMEMMRQKD